MTGAEQDLRRLRVVHGRTTRGDDLRLYDPQRPFKAGQPE
jgi:hypothetical protein